ncbi:hypothetical protein [Streptomyces sp. NPDC017086]|uniref:hypothetical protein n=1 Tax=Streptomyces sp. NPDC017086 TaxID=3364976 RepID=UPI00378D1F8C
MSSRNPITPTRVIPAGEPLPAPAAPPLPPPPPRVPPAPLAPGPGPDWWRHLPRPAVPPQPVPVDVHVTVTIDTGPADPPPEPWWRRIRWGYHAVMALAAIPLSGPWAWVLADVREQASLTGTWVIAVIPLAIVAWWDNAARIQARHSDPDLWGPKVRATAARLALYAGAEATALTLPLYSLVIILTGVRP